MQTQKFVSFDLETCLIAAGVLAPPVVCGQFCDESLEPELADHFDLEEIISGLLEDGSIVIVGANVAYDMACVIKEYPRLLKPVFAAYRVGRIVDVQIAQRLIDIANGELGGTYNHFGQYVKYYYSLAALHDRHGLGSLQKEGTWRLRYGELRGKRLSEYPPEAVKYALDDASATMKVWAMQWHGYSHLLTDLAAQTRAAFALHLMAVRGIHTDAAACDEYLVEVKAEIEAHRTLLVQSGLLREKTGSRDTKAAQAYMLKACAGAGVEPKLTATGAVCLDAEACRDVNDPVMRAYAAFVSAKNTVARTEKLKLGSGAVPLQTRFEVLVNNGRSSSMEPSEPLVGMNLQNMPRGGKARQVFRPRDGFVFCSCDFTGAELHTFAQSEKWLTGKSLLGDALNNKMDLHCQLGAAYLNCSYEEAYENRKVGKHAKARQLAKAANFGLAGGMGPQRFMDAVNKTAEKPEDRISLETATELKNLWLNTWQTQPYFDHISQLMTQGAAAVEHFISGRIRGKVSYTECANGFFSGLAADGFKAALWDLFEECLTDETSVLYGSHPLLPVHDEIIAELACGPTLHEAAFRQAEIMVTAYNRFVPDYPVRCEPALMKVWYKAAELVFDDDNRARPWDPQRDDPNFQAEKYLKRALTLSAA